MADNPFRSPSEDPWQPRPTPAPAGKPPFCLQAAFVLGIVGLAGGIRQRRTGTIVIAVLGVLLNAALVVVWISVLAMLAGGPR